MNSCWYVTDRWTVHDERWIAALASQGFEPHVLSVGRDVRTAEDAVEEIAGRDPRWPILAGPLSTITRNLVKLPNRVVGLSWGFDLVDTAGRGTQWIKELDHLIVDSVITRDVAIAAGLPNARITLMPWGIDPALFRPEGPRLDLSLFGVHPRQPTVLSLRAHEPMYAVGDLIVAWQLVLERVPDAVLLIGHSGSLSDSLQASASELGVSHSVRFIGTQPESDLPSLLRSVSIYVSTSPIDGTSVTMLQAMACELPVIVTDTLANRDWIEPGITGTLFAAGDRDDLGRAIVTVLEPSNAVLRNEMAVRARFEVLQRANWTWNVTQLGAAMREAE